MLPPSDLKRNLNHIIVLDIVLYKIIVCDILATMLNFSFFNILYRLTAVIIAIKNKFILIRIINYNASLMYNLYFELGA